MDEFKKYARNLFGIQLSPSQVADFEIYERELIEWNERFNLTAIHDPLQIRIKHFLDSLSCRMAMQNSPVNHVIDIGTGAGFPGIPLKILNPDMKLTLVESVGKKAAFCRHICRVLELKNVEILPERAEVAAFRPEIREQCDWAVARAVAALPILVEYLLPFVRVGGFALALKGESGHAEAHLAQPGIQLLGGEIDQLLPVTLPGIEEERFLVVIKKVAATPDRYPRRVGIPAKRPLGK